MRIPTLSDWDITASISLARAVGESAVLHQGWWPQRPLAFAAAGIANTAATDSTTSAIQHRRHAGFHLRACALCPCPNRVTEAF